MFDTLGVSIHWVLDTFLYTATAFTSIYMQVCIFSNIKLIFGNSGIFFLPTDTSGIKKFGKINYF